MKLFFIITIALMNFHCYDNSKTETIKEVISNSKIVSNKNKIITQNEIDRNDLIAFAKTFMGTRYVYAKQDPKIGFDCSGFINYVYNHYDVSVPRSSSGFKNFGRKIAIEDVQIGDVLVFTGYRDTTVIGHLGIVCEADGLNSKFIHASSGKIMQVTISELNSAHYSRRFLHAVDVINE